MKRESSSPSHPAAVGSRTSRRSLAAVAVVAVTALALGACGGDDDDDESSDSSSSTTLALDDTTTTTAATNQTTTSTTVAAPVPDEVDYVTEGASVVVANASGIDGAAGRMSERLAAVGYVMGTATNSTEGQLETTKVYFDPANPDAQPVAESLVLALGGGDIQLFELGTPAPVDDGSIGDATVLVTMGNDTADETLEELQGRAPATDTSTDTAGGDATDDTTADDTTDDSTDDTTADDTTDG